MGGVPTYILFLALHPHNRMISLLERVLSTIPHDEVIKLYFFALFIILFSFFTPLHIHICLH